GSESNLLLSCGPLCEQHVGHVATCDQQEEAHGCRQRVECRTELDDKAVHPAYDLYRELVRIILRIECCEPMCDRIDIAFGLFESDTWFKPGLQSEGPAVYFRV